MRCSCVCRAAALLSLGLLAACGGADATAPARPASGSAPPSVAASLAGGPSAASAEASPGAEASVVASVGAEAGNAPSAAAQASSAAGPYAGLPQSKTAEGYFVLGDPGAPVTLTFYSDFL